MDMIKLLNPRLLELMEADEQGRVIILPAQAEVQRFVVERALEIKLFDWQAAYIWGNSSYLMPGRATGKTLACIIKLCVADGSPIFMFADRAFNIGDIPEVEAMHKYHPYRAEVQRIYKCLEMYQVPGLRKIYFSRDEARADGYHCTAGR